MGHLEIFVKILDKVPGQSYNRIMNNKRPTVRIGDKVSLSAIKSMIPAYDGKPAVLRDTVLTVSSITGTGSKRNPFGVRTTDGTHFWGHEPGDLEVRS